MLSILSTLSFLNSGCFKGWIFAGVVIMPQLPCLLFRLYYPIKFPLKALPICFFSDISISSRVRCPIHLNLAELLNVIQNSCEYVCPLNCQFLKGGKCGPWCFVYVVESFGFSIELGRPQVFEWINEWMSERKNLFIGLKIYLVAGMVLYVSWIFYSPEDMFHFSNDTKSRNLNHLMSHWDTCQLESLITYMTIAAPK